MDDLARRSCLLIAKPRRVAAAFREDSLPPGMVAAFTPRHGFDSLNFLPAFLASLPSYIPLVATAEPALLSALRAFAAEMARTTHRELYIFPQTRQSLPTISDAHTLINTRPQPSDADLAGWLAVRLTVEMEPGSSENSDADDPAIGYFMVLAQIFRLEETATPDRTVQWRTHQLLRCRPSDLRRLAALARQPRLHATVDRLAAECGTTAWRLGQRTRCLLGVSAAEFNAMAGWEPILEAAVRHGLGREGWGRRTGGQADRTKVTSEAVWSRVPRHPARPTPRRKHWPM